MKRIPLIISLLALCLLQSCSPEAEQDIFCNVTLQLSMPTGKGDVLSMEVDMDRKGNFFRNLNNLQEYDIPAFVGNSCMMKVQKGVYIIGFDAVAKMSDGTEKTLRCAGFSSPSNAVNLLGKSETVVLDLIVLK